MILMIGLRFPDPDTFKEALINTSVLSYHVIMSLSHVYDVIDEI